MVSTAFPVQNVRRRRWRMKGMKGLHCGRRAERHVLFCISKFTDYFALCPCSSDPPHRHLLQAIEKDGASPPPPPPPKPSEERLTKMVISAIGCVLTVITYCNPVIVFWSTGSNLASTTAFCTMPDFISSALSTASWLMFSIVQLNGKDGRIVGLEAVLTNASGLALLAVFITFKLVVDHGMGFKMCLGFLCGFGILVGLYVWFAMLVPVKRDSCVAKVIAIVASVFQGISQAIPIYSVWVLYRARAGPPAIVIRNMKPLLVYSRASSFTISLYWAMYATLTYQHTVFELANIASTAMGFLSLSLHLIYALFPEEDALEEHNE
ncbi:uncharacterized protein LOC123395734 [Hordeum vulgare subsp. vulgare]|uniref:uncharacterized protein LOC123395734 n=1 Tax=Hordeum vulgare subsp. vulgare TaxID=112509 RepID=UPI001D1A5048|nr:uncharacterized protein LOC123395734 [Hordeum vulgare subsp. vulgare]